MLKKQTSLSAEYVRQRLHYDPETGYFTWRPIPVRAGRERFDLRWNTMFAGKRAGHIWTYKNSRTKYISIGLKNTTFQAHRLAYLYMTGEFPQSGIDHEDGDGLNNRWRNLRPSNQSQNKANARLNANNTTGFKGVHPHGQMEKYVASIGVNGSRKYLGFFDTPEEAAAAYKIAASKYFGEFART